MSSKSRPSLTDGMAASTQALMDKLVLVALRVNHNDGIFTYRLKDVDDRDFFGYRVKVQLKKRLMTGIIVGNAEADSTTSFAIKEIVELIDREASLTHEQFSLLKFCAHYYWNNLGLTVHLAVLRNEKASKALPPPENKSSPMPTLSLEQEGVVAQIFGSERSSFLLEGVTGSGKTHVYLKIAQETLAEGKSVLFLVPEISLTPQLVNRVESALGIKPLVMHSDITAPKKRDAIFSLIRGYNKILIGARSAIFAPLPQLGLIVVDEEHDSSLKQDEAPRYHARDLALWRAKQEGARIILGSATPSLESIYNVEKGKLTKLCLPSRFNHARPLPAVSVIDLKERQHNVESRLRDANVSAGAKLCILSRPLVDDIKETLQKGAQVLLFLNQRGYAKFGVCYRCGHMVNCPNCSVGLTYYQNRRLLMCHLCKAVENAHTICRNCKQDAVRFLGLGTERLEEEVRLLFPEHRVLRLDRDVVQSQRRLVDTLNAMHEKEADILIGTQMIAKGHDFLHVGLVGVVCADVALSMPDFRASEKTFQLLTQVAGRAGRGHFIGKAVIQTFNPQSPSIEFAKTHDVSGFITQELSLRRRFSQPPYTKAALLRCEHPSKETAENIMAMVREILSRIARLSILGPAPSPIEKINLRFRFQCMVIAASHSILHQALLTLNREKSFVDACLKSRARFIIDVDPQSLA